ncbi:hypothetical protein BT93_K0078 [Corymbia citriodora subsp. variegata]|nr:hypothetical protein BT93_K0078 [Corymbia citriodora subsp. variegata]
MCTTMRAPGSLSASAVGDDNFTSRVATSRAGRDPVIPVCPGVVPSFLRLEVNSRMSMKRISCCITHSELEEEVVDYMAKLWPLKTVGPAIPSICLDKRLQDDKDYGINLFRPDTEICLNWLSDKPIDSVIYVSFGSMAELDFPNRGASMGLEKLQQTLLVGGSRVGEGKAPSRFAEHTCSRMGIVMPWGPQLEILAHRSTGCFLTHCRWNSVLKALGLGMPMVAMPQWTDQGTNAKFVEDVWGVGARASKDEDGIVRRGEMERCICEVMEGERGKEIKRNAEKWRKLAK